MLKAIPHLHPPLCWAWYIGMHGWNLALVRIVMFIDSLRSKHVSCQRILIVKPLSYVITSINHQPLSSAVTILLICACSMAWVIYSDLGNLEAVTFIFPGNRRSISTNKRFLTSTSFMDIHQVWRWNGDWNWTKRKPNDMIKYYKLYERSNQKVKYIQAIDVQFQILPLTSGASIWPKLNLIDGI